MSPSPDDKEPVIEPKPFGERGDMLGDDVISQALYQRIRQQELLAELGVLSLQGASFMEMLNHGARITAKGLEAEYCKVLEYQPAENRLLLRAGVGWDDGVIGHASVGADLESPGGYALRTGKPVISNHLENEQRFRTPELLARHGIRRAMNVILQGDGSPFGVLEVDSTSEGEFGEHDVAFLQGAANILGMAIEQQRYRHKLQAALDHHQVLLREVNHRVKNSLQVVSSLLQLQANSAGDQELKDRLQEAANRVNAVGRAYEHLAYTTDYASIDLIAYLREIVEDLRPTVVPCQIEFEGPEAIQFAADRAILVGLIINELVTNSGKHAYPDRPGGLIWVRALTQRDGQTILISVRDEGVGWPVEAEITSTRRMGSRLVNALAKQLGGELTRPATAVGANSTLLIPA
jgi:two-component sensor histidine kinase